MSKYCPKCGDTGELFDTGERCTCPLGMGVYGEIVNECLVIPEQYRGNSFNTELIPEGLGDYFKKYMEELYTGVSNMTLRNVNIFLSTPPKHGKTFLAYSCIEKLYRRGVPVFPLYDVMEIKRMIVENDYGKKVKELENKGLEISLLYSAQYLFVKIPSDLSFAVFDTIKLLLERRLRSDGGVTIFLSDLGWSYLSAADSKKVFSTLLGDGSFGTIINKTFYAPGGDKND